MARTFDEHDDPLNYAIRYLLGNDGLYDKGTVVGGDETLLIQTLGDLPFALWEVFGLPTPDVVEPPASPASFA